MIISFHGPYGKVEVIVHKAKGMEAMVVPLGSLLNQQVQVIAIPVSVPPRIWIVPVSLEHGGVQPSRHLDSRLPGSVRRNLGATFWFSVKPGFRPHRVTFPDQFQL